MLFWHHLTPNPSSSALLRRSSWLCTTIVPGSYVAPVKPAKVYWRYVEKSYCAGNNMDILAIPDVKRHPN